MMFYQEHHRTVEFRPPFKKIYFGKPLETLGRKAIGAKALWC